MKIFMDKNEYPCIVKSTKKVKCKVDTFWRISFTITIDGKLEAGCNGYESVVEVCDKQCVLSNLLDIDRFILSKDFGQGNVQYLQRETGLKDVIIIESYPTIISYNWNGE